MNELGKKQILVMWQSGMPISRIRQMVAMPIKEFRKVIAEMRKDGEFSGGRQSTEEKVVEAFDNGERNVREIANLYGIKTATVYLYLRKNKRYLGRKTRHLTHSPKTVEICEDLNDGEISEAEIARKHGVSRQYVNKIKKKFGG